MNGCCEFTIKRNIFQDSSWLKSEKQNRLNSQRFEENPVVLKNDFSSPSS